MVQLFERFRNCTKRKDGLGAALGRVVQCSSLKNAGLFDRNLNWRCKMVPKNIENKYQILCQMLDAVAGSDGVWRADLFLLRNNLLKYNNFFASKANVRKFMTQLVDFQDSGEPLSPWRVTSKAVPTRVRGAGRKWVFTFRKPLPDGRVSHL